MDEHLKKPDPSHWTKGKGVPSSFLATGERKRQQDETPGHKPDTNVVSVWFWMSSAAQHSACSAARVNPGSKIRQARGEQGLPRLSSSCSQPCAPRPARLPGAEADTAGTGFIGARVCLVKEGFPRVIHNNFPGLFMLPALRWTR